MIGYIKQGTRTRNNDSGSVDPPEGVGTDREHNQDKGKLSS